MSNANMDMPTFSNRPARDFEVGVSHACAVEKGGTRLASDSGSCEGTQDSGGDCNGYF